LGEFRVASSDMTLQRVSAEALVGAQVAPLTARRRDGGRSLGAIGGRDGSRLVGSAAGSGRNRNSDEK
jgi:hypothetical protein